MLSGSLDKQSSPQKDANAPNMELYARGTISNQILNFISENLCSSTHVFIFSIDTQNFYTHGL
jgi:hypothetical protein